MSEITMLMKPSDENKYNNRIMIRNAELIFVNFTDKKFSVFIDDDRVADKMLAEGWNVKIKPPYYEDEEARNILDVTISYRDDIKKLPQPKIYTVSPNRVRTYIEPDQLSLLDGVRATKVDLILRPRYWKDERDGGKVKIKAYLEQMHYYIEANPLEEEFAEAEYPTDDLPY